MRGRRLSGSDVYRNKLTGSTSQYEGSRKQAIDTVLGKYRSAAHALLFVENDGVRNAATQAARAAAINKVIGPQANAQQQR